MYIPVFCFKSVPRLTFLCTSAQCMQEAEIYGAKTDAEWKDAVESFTGGDAGEPCIMS
jgi:hypothetical protein